MATLSKKLRIKNSAGVQETAELYTTPEEVGTPNLPLVVDGVKVYALLVPTNSGRATSCRVKLPDGTKRAVGIVAPTEYGWSIFLENGTFTVPKNVYMLRVTCVGGGSGGCNCKKWSPNDSCRVTNGGNTTFGSVIANGGRGAVWHKWSSEGSDDWYWQSGSTGYHPGKQSCWKCEYSGGAPVQLVGVDGVVHGACGRGGHADAPKDGLGYTGASGFRTIATIRVTPGQKIAATIGGGGPYRLSGGSTGYGTRHADKDGCGTSGSSGGVLVEWGVGVE